MVNYNSNISSFVIKITVFFGRQMFDLDRATKKFLL